MMMKKKNLQILLICGVLLVTACKSKSKEEQQSGYRMEGDTVQITDRFLSEKIKVTVARLEPYSKEVITSGVVRPIPTRYACIASPFAGRVTKSYIQIGQQVNQEPLCLKSAHRILLRHKKNTSRHCRHVSWLRKI